MGAPGRTDCDRGEVQLSDGVGGDGAEDGEFLPVRVGVGDQQARKEETSNTGETPEYLSNLALMGLC